MLSAIPNFHPRLTPLLPLFREQKPLLYLVKIFVTITNWPIFLSQIKLSNGQLFQPLEQRKKLLESEDFFLQKYHEKNGKRRLRSMVTSFNETPVHGVPKGK